MLAKHYSPFLVVKWSDKNVTMISVYHGNEIWTVTKREKQKIVPVCVLDYSQYVGGVNLKDQLLQSHLVQRQEINK
jgi:hypothetical protein